MRIIGVTGGIASGKSLIEQCFIEHGIPVIDADVVAREVVHPGGEAYDALYAAFGPAFFHADGTLDRAKLREHVFSDPAALENLNGITHPAIARRIAEQLATMDTNIIALIAPLLVETGLNALCDTVWLITCDAETRIDRLTRRDGISRETALAIISAQLTDCEKAYKSDIIIDNSGEAARTTELVNQMICEEIHLGKPEK